MILVDPVMEDKPKTEIKERPSIENLISLSAPNSTATVSNAIQLLNQIKDAISWNENLEINIRNKIIPKSNIVKLLLYATNQAKSKKPVPIGWGEFSKFLGQVYTGKNVLSSKFQNPINRNDYEKIQKWEMLV